MLIASLAPLLIVDLGLNRAQIGLLSIRLVFFYTFVGLFLGMAADRLPPAADRGRRRAVGAMTALSARAEFRGARDPAHLRRGRRGDAHARGDLDARRQAPPRRLGLAVGVYYARAFRSVWRRR
jgi:hypothetical protein